VKKCLSAMDSGFVCQNVYLYAASEGLSTVVLGWIDRPLLAKEMDLKETQEIMLSQPIGYPGE
jgi:nitroreductase